MVGATGFEPVTTRTPSVCATRLRYAPTMVGGRAKSIITTEVNQFKCLMGGDSVSQDPSLRSGCQIL